MPTLKEIGTRIEGIRKIQRVANALEVVAATKLRRRERLVLASRPYASGIRQILEGLVARTRGRHPLLWRKPGAREVAIVLLTSDRGLCGAFNDNVIRSAMELSREFAKAWLIIVGRKGASYFRRKGYPIVAQYRDIEDKDLGGVADGITAKIMKLYTEESIGEVYLVYNKFRLHLIGQVWHLQLLPVEAESPQTILTDYLYEPTQEEVLDRLIPAYIACEVRQAIQESRTSEEMARMVAMKMASDNTDELIEKLSLDYHKARQAAITREMIELVSGGTVF